MDFLFYLFTQLIAVECLHGEDIVHYDIFVSNIMPGVEPEPENGTDRRDDVLYDTDFFLFGKVEHVFNKICDKYVIISNFARFR